MIHAGRSTDDAFQRVFCTHKRLEEGEARASGEKRIFDKGKRIPEARLPAPYVLKKVLLLMKAQHQSSVTKEFLKSKLDCSLAMAYTLVPDEEDANEPDTLQICPWFLDYAMMQNAQFQSQFSAGKTATMIRI